jgi:hypothetical protein
VSQAACGLHFEFISFIKNLPNLRANSDRDRPTHWLGWGRYESDIMFRFFPSAVLGVLLVASTTHTVIACEPDKNSDSKIYQFKQGAIGAFAPEDIEKALMYKRQGDEAAYADLLSRSPQGKNRNSSIQPGVC